MVMLLKALAFGALGLSPLLHIATAAWLPPPPCGEVCYKLAISRSRCSTSEGDLYDPIEMCYYNDRQLIVNYVDCVVNGGFCTTLTDEQAALDYMYRDGIQNGMALPSDHTDMLDFLGVVRTAGVTHTTFDLPIFPTTYTWTFTATEVYLDVITRVGPCGAKTTSPEMIETLQKRDDAITVTSTSTLIVTVTNWITITARNNTSTQNSEETGFTVKPLIQPIIVAPGTDSIATTDSIPIDSIASTDSVVATDSIATTDSIPVDSIASTDSVVTTDSIATSTSLNTSVIPTISNEQPNSQCNIEVTVTKTRPLVTTFYSTMTYDIITQESRSIPTELHTFWRPDPVEIPSAGHKISFGESKVLVKYVGVCASIIMWALV